MAKQTFTTGQVLTAAQMTSLQQTAMGGGAATAKTANYVLVAADAGTTVAMNAAGSTTITVNTGLFAAGDTVFIQNLGAGACTVTAGTATVATAGSLILPQNDAGILYFTATGAAIFYDYIQAGAVSPLTTKGDLYTFSTSDTRLGVGANGTTLVADSSEATGLKWQAAAGGGMTLLETLTLTGSSTTSSSLSSSYKHLFVAVENVYVAADEPNLTIRFNSDTNSNYTYQNIGVIDAVVSGRNDATTNTNIEILNRLPNVSTQIRLAFGEIMIRNYTNTSAVGLSYTFTGSNSTPKATALFGTGVYNGTAAISTITFTPASSTFSGGTALIYGVN